MSVLSFLGKAVGVALGAGALATVAIVYMHTENEKQAVASPTSVLRVSAGQLQVDYAANEVRADQMYRGHVLSVSGVVQAIKKDFTDSPYLELRTQNDFEPVHAEFDDDAALASLAPGQSLAVRCIGDNVIAGSPVLSHCVIDAGDASPSTVYVRDPNIGTPCTVTNAGTVGHTSHGTCHVREACTSPSVYYTGACPGSADIVCCVTE